MTPTITLMNKWFDEFNALVFDNKLPKVPIKFNNTYRQLGQFYWRNGGVTLGIKISLFYDRTETQYRNCLLHEMCHLYCFKVLGLRNEHHGANWRRIAAYATKKTGLHIQRCENASEFQVAERNKVKVDAVRAKKTAPAIIVEMRNGTQYFLLKTTDSVIDKHISEYPRNGWHITNIYISNNPMFNTWPIRRTLHWGYKYDEKTYNEKFKAIFETAEKRQILSVRRNAFCNWD